MSVTPELTCVCRAGLGEANVSWFQLLLSEMKREQVQESFTVRPTEPHGRDAAIIDFAGAIIV